MTFKVFRWCFSKTFHRKKFFNLAEVSCFQIQTELHMTGTCGTLPDAYQAGSSVLLKPLWFQKKPWKNRFNAWINLSSRFSPGSSMSDVFPHVRCLNQSLKSWNIELLSIKAADYTAPGQSTWPSRLWEQQRYLEILRVVFFRIFLGGQSSGWLKWWVWVGGFELGAGHCNNMQ